MSYIANDLQYILAKTSTLWEELRNQRIFITGGTGFFGCWLIETLIAANNYLNLNCKVVVLTRNSQMFAAKYPYLFYNPVLDFYQGDIRSFSFPEGYFSHIIHAATDVSSLQHHDALLTWDTIVEGTRRTFDFARQCGAQKILLVSSGAVYGKSLINMDSLSETHCCQLEPENTLSTYANGKFAAEHLAFLYAKQYQLDIKIARCFAFVGPYLPLDGHFAIGHFIRDSLQGKTITVNSDGSAYRSYLYTADLMIWLWTILFQGQTLRPYNVGSDDAYTIADIANMVAKQTSTKSTVNIMLPPSNTVPQRYIPDISRARMELGLKPYTSIEQAIQATIRWHHEEK